MKFNLLSKSTKQLSTKNIKEICLLKNSQWKFGLNSQINWFKNNIKPNDLHNCFFIKNHIIGYTLLRQRKLYVANKKISYLLFDTLVLKKNLRKKKLSNLMMMFNNDVIKKKNKIAFLICKKNLLNFYEKFFWKKINNKKFKIVDHAFNSNGMLFNYKGSLNKIKKPIKIYMKK